MHKDIQGICNFARSHANIFVQDEAFEALA